ncbi:Na+-transporting NADH:ubiquinone oxidoreductase subunit F [Colwellia sp. PAMC 20917]|uniref:2Fe-2S iron-sulfur cluster-binding protein n=1 Tax=Colwellia sp. PAMC 20917 TaxID=1816218 RepID=UPI0008787755|nr:2Fe-2S iron-sulfur cluster-binding protein [Colwellia sp. PAMC 20917]AOW75715.1 Na+-transporting NADH:ubiquinone oxidoreductase subunit F [Colwellia sp. PAMC 20917]
MLLLKKLHKWLSLLVGLQLFIWLGTGLYFNLMDHEKASGNQFRQRPTIAQVDISRLVEPQLVLSRSKRSVSLKQISLLAQPYYLLTHQKGLYSHFINNYSLVDAYTGEPVLIDEAIATKLAQSSYNGQGAIKRAIKLSPPYDDIPREKNHVWQINYADHINTSVYIDAGSGRIIKHSNDDKRFVDIFFMLHFMDYGSEGSFNNVQNIVFAIFTLFFSLTGLIWTIELAFNGQYKVTLGRKKRKLALFDKHHQSMGEIDVSTKTNLLDGLIEHDIFLSSTCGGGGTCGQCKVLLDKRVRVTSADSTQFTTDELQQGFRLACQHNGTEIERLTLVDVTKAKKHLLELTSSEFISPFIKELRFKIVGGNKLAFKAGAHMQFFIPAAKGVSIPQRLPEKLKPHWHHIDHLEYEHKACSRNYSLANGKGENDGGAEELVFTIKIQNAPNRSILPGVGSSYLCNLALGQTIDAVGPFEYFCAKPLSNKTMILVGAGSGMAPLKSLIEEQLTYFESKAEKGRIIKRDIYFFYGARTEDDLLYQSEFFQLAKQFANFNYFPVLSQPSAEWTGAKGYVQELLKLQIEGISQINNVEFYLCGPPDMMSTTIDLLKTKNVDASNIAFDEFTQ